MPRRVKVECAEAFPHGLFMVGELEPLRDFDKSTRDRPVQAVDEETGFPVWTFDGVDGDPDATKATRSVSIRIIAQQRPVPPEAAAVGPFRPVELQGLTATPYVDSRNCSAPDEGRQHRCRAKNAWSYRATGFADPAAGSQRKSSSSSSTSSSTAA